jgi:hypothetical protein
MNPHRFRTHTPSLCRVLLIAVGALSCGSGAPSGVSSQGNVIGQEGTFVPVATSVVGPSTTPSTAAATNSTTRRPTTSTTAAPDFGEGKQPITVPQTTAAPLGPAAAPAEDVARKFLAIYWAPAGRTYGQLADALDPYAGQLFLLGYRDPVRAGQPVEAGGATTVGEITVKATAASDVGATVVGRGVTQGANKQVVWRTLDVKVDPQGVWRVEGVK